MEQKKYHDIVRLGHRSTIGVLNPGDKIIIQEKIDGANASFVANKNGEIHVFSRNNKLSEENTLGGFYNWVLDNIDPNQLLKDYIYFGEWTNPHKIKYSTENMKQFFLFDIYNPREEKYLMFGAVKNEAIRLKLRTVPVFYEGEYKDFEHLQSFVGKTMIGGHMGEEETGEGIVVKNVHYRDRSGKQVFVKLVTDKFAEVQKQKKPKDPNKLESQEGIFVSTFMTKARVEKILFKLIDENIVHEHFGIEDMGIILKNMGDRIVEDMMKEEKDELPDDFDMKNIKKSVGKKLPLFIKEIINEREQQI